MEQRTTEIQPSESATATQLMVVGKLRRQLADLMRIEVHEIVKPPDQAILFRGEIYGDTQTAFERISQRFATYDYTASIQDRAGGGHEVFAIKGVHERKPGRVWVNVVLFLATLFSVLYTGAANAMLDARIEVDPESLEALIAPLTHLHWGIPFAATLLGILLAHELSHYFVARRHGSPVSLPYFIPMPPFFSIIGTMGAVIVQRAPMRSRRALFDIGIAGPLGGLVVAIPLLVLGLSLSSVGTPPPEADVVLQEGNSILYLGLKYLVFGRVLPSGGEDVWLHSVAFAAWVGLLVTMINLIPVGQLDGGHIAYALLGRRAWTLGYVAIGAMLAWGGWLLTGGNQAGGFWMTWGFLNMMVNRRHPPPLDDSTRLGWSRVAMGLLALAIFVLLFMPEPMKTIYLQ